MVGGKKVETIREGVFGTVGENIGRAAGDDADVEEMGEVTVPGDLAEAHDHADAREIGDLTSEVRRAVANLLREGFVAGRSAADDRGNPGMAELEAIVAGDSARFAGEAQLVQDGVHEVAGAVAGEGTAGAVGSVGSGSEAKDENASFGIAEAGYGASPVDVILVGTAADLADTFAVGP